MQLNASTFVVMGAAGGIADATIRHFHAAGARLVILDADLELERNLAAELGASALFCHVDGRTDADLRATLQEAQERFGPLNGLINFAHIDELEYPGLEGMELISRFVSAGLVRTFDRIRAVVATMGNGELERSTGGVIVNVAAPSGSQGRVETPAYAACKAGMLFLSLSVAREFATTGIRVISIASGPYDKPMVAAWPLDAARSLDDSLHWPGRLESPSDYASLVQHLLEYEAPARASNRVEGLSQREIEVLHLIAQGKTNKQIGRMLGISARTVQVHTSKIYGKIGVANRTSAVLWLNESRTQRRDSSIQRVDGGAVSTTLSIDRASSA